MTTVIWRFSDGRPGHDNQSGGLVEALSRRLPVHTVELPAASARQAVAWWLTHRYPPGDGLPAPDLLVGAGHATHLSLLAARRRHGGRSVVLMQPSLPNRCFDLCLVPRHDKPAMRDNVLTTQGVLNRIVPGGRHREDAGLIIIGGPSRHVRWDDDRIVAQVEDLQRQPRYWRLTTSPRTPPALAGRLAKQFPQLPVTPYAQTAPDWLPAQLADAGEIWVSRDSVSMIYEALTSGASVGLLDVPAAGRSRVAAGVGRLINDGWVTVPGKPLAPGPPQPLDEAARCADWIVREWLSEN